MLKKFQAQSNSQRKISVGDPVFLLTRQGNVMEGFFIKRILMDLVDVEPSPIEGSDKQGFTIKGDRLLPNWCAGKKVFVAGFLSEAEAREAQSKRQDKKRELS